jgi:hypothetical protein
MTAVSDEDDERTAPNDPVRLLAGVQRAFGENSDLTHCKQTTGAKSNRRKRDD